MKLKKLISVNLLLKQKITKRYKVISRSSMMLLKLKFQRKMIKQQ